MDAMIKAPATCHKCRIQIVNPTTGLVLNRCHLCGGEIQSDHQPKLVDGIARRCRVDLYTTEEKVIADAMAVIEAAGAHPLLTEAVILLGQAKDKVSDYFEQL